MKNNYKYIAILLLIVSISGSSCSDELNIDSEIYLSENQIVINEDNLKAALLGSYDALSHEAYYGGLVRIYSELAGGDGEVSWVGTFNSLEEVTNHTMISNNSEALTCWEQAYRSISGANIVLENIGVINEDERNTIKGEALILRALAHFELVRLYGLPYQEGQDNTQLGVPIITKKLGVNDSQLARNTVEEVYSQVINDLKEAINIMDPTNGNRLGANAANAILARVYLQMGKYQEATTAADAVLQSGDYSLVGNIADGFNQTANTLEDVFAIQVSDQDGDYGMITYYSIPDFGGRDGDIEINDSHLEIYEEGDDRGALHYNGNGATRTGKWINAKRNMSVIRLAEMYLIRAECNHRMGTEVGDTPLNDINVLRERSGLSSLESVDIDLIIHERRVELAHEGHKLHDIKRLKLTSDGLEYNDPKLIFPIPARELIINSKMIQNPGY